MPPRVLRLKFRLQNEEHPIRQMLIYIFCLTRRICSHPDPTPDLLSSSQSRGRERCRVATWLCQHYITGGGTGSTTDKAARHARDPTCSVAHRRRLRGGGGGGSPRRCWWVHGQHRYRGCQKKPVPTWNHTRARSKQRGGAPPAPRSRSRHHAALRVRRREPRATTRRGSRRASGSTTTAAAAAAAAIHLLPRSSSSSHDISPDGDIAQCDVHVSGRQQLDAGPSHGGGARAVRPVVGTDG